MQARRWMWILWPAFLLACALEVLVFALVDPGDLNWRGEALHVSRQTVYTAGFFAFWLLATGAGALTLLLTRPASELNNPAD